MCRQHNTIYLFLHMVKGDVSKGPSALRALNADTSWACNCTVTPLAEVQSVVAGT